jgi:predicted dehydrogenase
MVDFEFPEFPAMQKTKEMIDRSDLGPLQSVTLEWTLSTWANPKRPWAWQCDRAQGGVMRALGIHMLSYIEWFASPVESLTATLSTAMRTRPDATGAPREVTAEDTAHLELRLGGGVPVNVTVSNVLSNANGHVLRFQGEKGTLLLQSGNRPGAWEEFALTHVMGDGHRTIECPRDPTSPDGRIPAFVRLASRFVDAVERKNTAVQPSFVEGLRAQVLYDAVMLADRQKKWIDVSSART